MKKLMFPIWLMAIASTGTASDREALAFFERQVRPVLAEHCLECHGPEKQRGGLRLDFRDALLSGGESGPALVPGQPDQSLLLVAVHRTDPDLEMPPKGSLPKAAVTALERWVAMGAPWPQERDSRPEPSQAQTKDRFTEEDRAWWAIQPVQNPVPPPHRGPWVRNEIDSFVLAQLQSAGLEPAPEADRVELLRRASYDLLGLPPTREQLVAFVNDPRPDAWERVLDELLASPQYGERWAQHWLDVVRWAESDGYRQDAYRPQAWPYRDYVIASFNADKPYDAFVKEQLAGDEVDRDNPNVLIGTAFLRNGIYEYNQRDARFQWDLIVHELTNVTSEAFLGLGLGCAQCHDHKFDPLLQRDYYALQAFLAPVSWRFDLPLATVAEQRAHSVALAKWEAETAEIRAAIDAILDPLILKAQQANRKMFPEDIQAMISKPRDLRTPLEQQLVELVEIQTRYERERFNDSSVKGDAAERLKTLRAELAKFDPIKPKPLPIALVATDVGPEAPEVLLKNRRGSTAIPPGFPSILNLPQPVIASPRSDSTGRRLALANWIAETSNPLSTRVMTNRIWQHHFGNGLVATPNDFGNLGESPSHPELLDWLTTRFVQGGWRLKPLHRLIMTSATYRQTARREPGQRESVADPSNRLLWRFPPQRLDAEQIRDTMLVASGELLSGSPSGSVDGTTPRRSIYVRKLRNSPDPVLAAFDLPAGFSSSPTRPATTTPLQALFLTNGEWPQQRARAMAQNLAGTHSGDHATTVRQAYSTLFSREPNPSELALARTFLSREQALAKPPRTKQDDYPGETGLRPLAQNFADLAVPISGLGTHALWLQPGSPFERLEASLADLGDHFVVEAVVQLDNLHPDSTVSTLVSRWNGSPLSPGWTVSVTGKKSKYSPGSLIVQLTGEDDQGNTHHEVVASGLNVPLRTPIYVAAEIHTPRVPRPGASQTGTVTFLVRDLSKPDAKIESTTVVHPVVSPPQTPSTRFLVGGRDQSGHLWDGQVAKLRISPPPVPVGNLLTPEPVRAAPWLDWIFSGPTAAPPQPGARWMPPSQQTGGTAPEDAAADAMSGFVHALLNSSEFLYLH